MKKEDILGTWRSMMVLNPNTMQGQPYTRQSLIFHADGTGTMKSKTLFGRTKHFTWEYDPGKSTAYNDDSLFYIYNLGGPGAIATAMIEPTGEMGVIEYPAGAKKGQLSNYAHLAMLMIYQR